MTLFEKFYKSKEFNWKPGLERIKKAVEETDFKTFPSIIVAGTNGKGSTSHMIAEILRQNGLKVGLFTSPHLLRFNERIKVDMKEVDTEILDSSFKEIIPLVEKYQLTYFEASFLLSLKVFHDAKVEVAVFEVGLGGRLDATNAVSHELAVITRVGLDHTDYLGNTLTEIAREKVAVIKKGIPAVISDNPPVVKELSEERTKELFVYGVDFKAERIKVSPSGTEFLYNRKVIKTSLI
ncbi:MAG: bifunctional folylpolyglutamate synthase/dihydrofolate synthase, partial [Desulfurobacterium sp.]